MLFEQDYNNLIQRIKPLLKLKRADKAISAQEVIAEAYLLFNQSGENYSFDTFIKYAGRAIDSLRNQLSPYHLKEDKISFMGITDNFCPCCKLVLSIDLFYTVTKHKKGGIKVKDNYCKECRKKKNTACKKKRTAPKIKKSLQERRERRRFLERKREKKKLIELKKDTVKYRDEKDRENAYKRDLYKKRKIASRLPFFGVKR